MESRRYNGVARRGAGIRGAPDADARLRWYEHIADEPWFIGVALQQVLDRPLLGRYLNDREEFSIADDLPVADLHEVHQLGGNHDAGDLGMDIRPPVD